MKEIYPYLKDTYYKIPIICGPTASGKSRLSLALAQKTQGVLCSCDSMQIYRHMDIGTAKATASEQALVPHRLLDIAEPSESFSVVRWQALALETIELCLTKEKRLPIFCGGTGQYVSALSQGIEYLSFETDLKIRAELEAEAQHKGYPALYAELTAIDPEAAAKIHPNNHRRVIRALEIYRQTGKTMSDHNAKSKEKGPLYPFSLFAIEWLREDLYRRMDLRVDQMLTEGLVDEVRALLEMEIPLDSTAMQAIGYQEISLYLKGKMSLEEAVQQMKQRTRNYGKRQLTWFRHLPEVIWISPDDQERVLEIISTPNH